MATAKQLAARKLFAQRSKAGTLGRGSSVKRKTRKNPDLSRVPQKQYDPDPPKLRGSNPVKRKAAKAVKRVSQASGAKPSARLVARRKKTATAPKGFFANPAPKRIKSFRVEKAAFDGGKWSLVASFVSLASAKEYATAVAKQSGDYFVRVVD